MADTKTLEAKVIENIRLHDTSSSALLQIAREQHWPGQDVDVREAIWRLLETQRLELTPNQKLRLAQAEVAAASR